MTRFRSGDASYDVDLRPTPRGAAVSVNGRRYDMVVAGGGHGGWTAEWDGRRERLAVAQEDDRIDIWWRGRTYRLTRDAVLRRAARAATEGAVEAAMPGRVVAVSVQPGQEVRQGDVLLVVESMKMENPLRAPRDGRVASVGVKVGDRVAPGVPLLELS